MEKKVWSGLFIGVALGIFLGGSLFTLLLFPEMFSDTDDRDPSPSEENVAGSEEPGEEENGEEEESFPAVEMEVEENHSVEELVYDLMVEGVITSKAQQQEITEVLTYRGIKPGTLKIPLYASTDEILEVLEGP